MLYAWIQFILLIVHQSALSRKVKSKTVCFKKCWFCKIYFYL